MIYPNNPSSARRRAVFALGLIGLALSLCFNLSACSTLGSAQNAPVSTAQNPENGPSCGSDNDHENWQISSSDKKMTVSHRYQNSHEHCEKKEQSEGQKNLISSAKGSSLQGLLRGETIIATVDLKLDASKDHSDKSTMHFTAI